MCDRSLDINKDVTFLLRKENGEPATKMEKDPRSGHHTTFYECYNNDPAGNCTNIYCASIYCPSDDSSICPDKFFNYDRSIPHDMALRAKKMAWDTANLMAGVVEEFCRDKIATVCPLNAMDRLQKCLEEENAKKDPSKQNFLKCLQTEEGFWANVFEGGHESLQDFFGGGEGHCNNIMKDTPGGRDIRYVTQSMTSATGAGTSNGIYGTIKEENMGWGFYSFIDENGNVQENEPKYSERNNGWGQTTWEFDEGSAECIPNCDWMNSNFDNRTEIIMWDKRFQACVWQCKEGEELVHNKQELDPSTRQVKNNNHSPDAEQFKCLRKCTKDGCPTDKPNEKSVFGRENAEGKAQWDGVCKNIIDGNPICRLTVEDTFGEVGKEFMERDDDCSWWNMFCG